MIDFDQTWSQWTSDQSRRCQVTLDPRQRSIKVTEVKKMMTWSEGHLVRRTADASLE